MLSDAFAILSSPWIRVGKDNRDDDDIEDPNVPTSNTKRVLLAKGQLLSNISRKHLIEILLPYPLQSQGHFTEEPFASAEGFDELFARRVSKVQGRG